MIIVADIGNSFLKMACWDNGRLTEVSRVRHRDLLDGDWLAALDDSVSRQSDGVFVASVAEPGVEQLFQAWLLSHGHDQPVFLKSSRTAGGLQNAYADPAALGVDRWCAMIAARSLHDGPMCVVDAGTAMTIDWVDVEGRHRGGLIMPGPTLQAESLFGSTRHLHEASDVPASLFADNTGAAVAAGVFNACAALVERACDEIAAQGRAEPVLVMTGGECRRIIPLLNRPAESHCDLVLQGVAILADEVAR